MVHPPPPTYSSCGCLSSRCGSLAESNQSIIIDFGGDDDDDDDDNNSTLAGSLCSPRDPSDSCRGLMNSFVNWNYVFDDRIDLCTSAPPPCSPCLIGKVTQPKPESYSKPTVTVWYNNEVYIHTCIYSL